MMPPKGPAVLVLCTGNSCRSQMAEAFLRERLGKGYRVLSAGTEPAAAIHPLAVQVMDEVGIDLRGQRPKQLSEYLGRTPVHTLITVCDRAAESCPAIWPGVRQRLHWSFPDPAAFRGTPEETLAEFRRVRDAIAARVAGWTASQATDRAPAPA